MSTVSTGPDPFTRLAHELARCPDLVAQLLTDHPAHELECPGCTTPGGRSTAAAPCSIRTLALMAEAHAHPVR